MRSDPHLATPNRRLSSSPYLLLTLVVVAMLATPGWTEIYRYRGPDGHWIISNMPPPTGSDPATAAPEGSGPSTDTTAPTASVTPRSQTAPPSPKRRRLKTRRNKRLAVSRPVNTHKFGLLEIGSSQAEVRRRIGQPARRVKNGRQRQYVADRGRLLRRWVRVETWFYPGNSRVLPTRLVFYNGKLAEKDKGDP